MKSIRKFILSSVAAMCVFPSCSDYLNIVPDKNKTLEGIYTTREEAYNALASVYFYMPLDNRRKSTWLLGDEWVQPEYNVDYTQWSPIRVMERRMTPDAPYLGIWSGTDGAKPLYVGIGVCNDFINRIDAVQDMSFSEKEDWKAQAKFLKAYYHFLLLRQYGPIVIMDKVVSPNDKLESMYVPRSKIDECFNYIVKTIDEAIDALAMRREGIDLGQIDKLGASAIKARVLLYRASKFYSGNGDYNNFYDADKGLFFPQDDAATTQVKWQDALTAINKAIELCEANGVAMYRYEKRILDVDQADFDANTDIMQTYYNLRMVICDRWNKELIWGCSNLPFTDNQEIYTDANIMIQNGLGHPGTMGWNNPRNSSQSLGASYKTLERFYTANGLPLDEDITFSDATKYDVVTTPGPSSNPTEYAKTRGILQPDAETIKLYLNRELRFYANVGITGSYWRAYSWRIPTKFYFGTPGGVQSAQSSYAFWTAIGAQKPVEITSMNDDPRTITLYPTPIIRLADLYLMKAEALNETLDAPNDEVWEAINKVRLRAGIPTVQDAYTGPNVTGTARGKHRYKDDMRDIIAHERKVEFAFEGHIFWDMLRARKAVTEFNAPVMGWDKAGENATDFFQVRLCQPRMFTLRDCLWPLPTSELNKNEKLIQNPGW
ncbi:RagB/SusD family nutrient uptake outer membrane protein [Candidatus Symbiothrix dinenymphae]|uniref:RagB/SusD family nutrient uptake outer membrane protein n=1 Tax=Candidatus Symbiothrix dinenymphae TaxID=467085 RepID=UPI0006C39D15|nr:RagB/SusD family nutrient uptake outer membrane protein [Candidatus Symbiothrix dinenymphae]GAP73011.1 RagB/SusD domain-containing protein [Candidatus Symbiothrix dinenymphae]